MAFYDGQGYKGYFDKFIALADKWDDSLEVIFVAKWVYDHIKKSDVSGTEFSHPPAYKGIPIHVKPESAKPMEQGVAYPKYTTGLHYPLASIIDFFSVPGGKHYA